MLTSSNNAGARVAGLEVTEEMLNICLKDGRHISVPLAWYPRLAQGSVAQRRNWQIAGAGSGIHWPELDEDLSVEGLLRGAKGVGYSA